MRTPVTLCLLFCWNNNTSEVEKIIFILNLDLHLKRREKSNLTGNDVIRFLMVNVGFVVQNSNSSRSFKIVVSRAFLGYCC